MTCTPGAAPATQVHELNVTASTTIKVGAQGNFVSGTPIAMKIPLPDTTWTVDGSAPVAFSQAGPGTLPSLPVGINDTVVPVSGSIVVKPTLGNLRFLMDCQPGNTAAPFKAFTPAFIVSGGTGGPVDSTLFYTLYLYLEAFANFRMGYASALAWIVSAVSRWSTVSSVSSSRLVIPITPFIGVRIS